MSFGVSSEVHQDLLFVDCLQDDIFADEIKDTETKEQCVTTALRAKQFNQTLFDILIDHHRSSQVDLVGLQIWRGSLLLADYILSHASEFEGKRVVEVASGTGLASIVAATKAAFVMATDIDRGGILELIAENFAKNRGLFPPKSIQQVTELDFFKEDWHTRLAESIRTATVLLVADVVYNREITQKFFSALSYFMVTNPLLTVLIAVEKRSSVGQNGALEALNFDHFLELLSKLMQERRFRDWKCKNVALDFHQFFETYERVNALHMWKLAKYSDQCDAV